MGKSKSAKYYASNPKARAKKKAYDTKANAKPKSRKYRSELNKARRKRGIYGKGGGDLAHTADGKRLVRQSPSKNRANNRPKKRNSK